MKSIRKFCNKEISKFVQVNSQTQQRRCARSDTNGQVSLILLDFPINSKNWNVLLMIISLR